MLFFLSFPSRICQLHLTGKQYWDVRGPMLGGCQNRGVAVNAWETLTQYSEHDPSIGQRVHTVRALADCQGIDLTVRV